MQARVMKALFSISIPLSLSLSLVLVLLLLIGTAPQVEARGKHPKLSPEEIFNKKDVNHDGRLTRTEFLAGTHNYSKDKAKFAALDKDGDGFLTLQEFLAGHKHKKSGSGS
jgi:Ca2+-binding EF-hand superfamily protein